MKIFSSFLTPMLEFDQDHRVTAAKCLEHPFLKPFGGRAPPSNTPIHVLKRLYPDGTKCLSFKKPNF